MKKKYILPISEFIFVGALGTLLHFTYELSDKNFYVGLFSAVNESTWEHLKLLFFPYLIFSIAIYFFTKNKESLIPSRAIGVLSGMAFIIIYFYTYTGILGYNIQFLDILSFFLGLLISQLTANEIYKRKLFNSKYYSFLFSLIIIAFIVLFTVYTYYPPRLGLFIEYTPII